MYRWLEAVSFAVAEIQSLHTLMGVQPRMPFVMKCYKHAWPEPTTRSFISIHFEEGDKALKRTLPIQDEGRDKFAQNQKGPFIVQKVLPGGALILAEMDGRTFPQPINSDMCKKFFI